MSVAEQTDEKRQESTNHGGTTSLLRRGFDTANRFLSTRGTNSLAQSVDPRTPPSRLISSNYSSPGSTFGKDEDAVLIELTPRYMLAGLEGESSPQCKISFTPDGSRRVGDYREWLDGQETRQENTRKWGRGYELWRNNIEGLDLDIVGSKVERAIQEIHNKYLLSDAGSSRLVLVAPSVVPHPVLEAILFALFERGRYPSITLLPAPMTAAISAGMRSALVIDIGWEETTITSLYECREIHTHHTVRAMKTLTRNVASRLRKIARTRPGLQDIRLNLPLVEELLTRTLSTNCYTRNNTGCNASVADVGLENMSSTTQAEHVEVKWSSEQSAKSMRMPKSVIYDAIEETFLAAATDAQDDEEVTLAHLTFTALRALPPDVRSLCMSRIVFTGEGSNMPLLKLRVLSELRSILQTTGWSHIKGTHVKAAHTSMELSSSRPVPADAKFNVLQTVDGDPVEYQVRKRKAKTAGNNLPSEVGAVETLGSWAGASLLTSVKIKGVVEIDRDRFLPHGLMGASREAEISVTTHPQRMGFFGAMKSIKVPDKSNWTLAGWG